jgi:hypothetical protein
MATGLSASGHLLDDVAVAVLPRLRARHRCHADDQFTQRGVLMDDEDQQEWYLRIYLPLVRRALAGERIDPWLLAGGTQEANEDETWDQRNGGNWANG